MASPDHYLLLNFSGALYVYDPEIIAIKMVRNFFSVFRKYSSVHIHAFLGWIKGCLLRKTGE